MTGFAPISGVGVLSLRGSDARRFLHGQCTQEIKAKEPGAGGYAFLLDARGRNLGDFRFLVGADGILCFLDASRIAAARAWLEKFVIAADVTITDVSPEWSGIVVMGEGSRELLRSVLGAEPPAAEDRSVEARFQGAVVLVVGDHEFGAPGFDVWGHGDDGRAAVSALAAEIGRRGADQVAPATLEAARIEAGHPRFGVDIDESTLPGETGQEERAVSYTKGCYSGQEVVAKQKYLGRPRRMLTRVAPEMLLPVPAPVFHGDVEIGTLTSAAVSPRTGAPVGLAMLRYPLPPPGAVLTARAGASAARIGISPSS